MTSLSIKISLEFMHSTWDYIVLFTPLLIIWNCNLLLQYRCIIFMCNLIIESLVSLYSVQYCCDKINMVSELMAGQNYFFKNMVFDGSCMQNRAKDQIPVLRQKQKVYHLIPQVKELLIKLSWSIMLGVMKT